MNTPIYDFLREYASSGTVRAHMPGHKGRSPYAAAFDHAFEYDITEIKGADTLFEAEGIIAESEKNASKLFGTAATFYSAGGSTLCIQAMLAAVCGSSRAFICARNSHRAAVNACVLLDLEPCWVYPEYEDGSAVSGTLTPAAAEAAIEQYAEKSPACVFVTSPDYAGNIADIRGIAEVCHRHGLPLLVDNAHGAYLAFLEPSLHPIHMGADMCCDSAHKTLPALTGAAYLHVGNGAFAPKMKRLMALFGSTSPNYLIMASLDLCNRYIAERLPSDLKAAADRLAGLKSRLGGVYRFLGDEPLKLTVYAPKCGLTGHELAERLREGGVEPEYADVCCVVMMFSAMSTQEDIERVEAVLKSIRMPRIRIEPPDFEVCVPKRKMLPRQAFFAESETVNTENAAGRTAAEAVTVCPPCVPIVMAGEKIDENIIKILKNYSIFQINVLK